MQDRFGSEPEKPVKPPHPSYAGRSVLPSMQLASQITTINGGLKQEYQGAIESLMVKEKIAAAATDKPFARNGNNSSNVNALLNPADSESEHDQAEVVLKRPTPNVAAAKANDIFGTDNNSCDDSERFKTTTQVNSDIYSKAHLDKKKVQGVKMIESKGSGANMVSPITGELADNYANWKGQSENEPKNDSKTELKPVSVDQNNPLLSRLHQALIARGAKGFLGLQRTFRIMDDDNSKTLSMQEFKKAMAQCNLKLSEADLKTLFAIFDVKKEGSISYDRFMSVIRGGLNGRRKALVTAVYAMLDKDGSGTVDVNDIIDAYDVTKHPEFMAGRRTKESILKELLSVFEIGGEVDGQVTLNEFENYYSNISASVDNDDYFELMIRNAWRMSGGVGMAANSANTRVLVTRADGTQGVEEIKNNLGLRAKDKEGMVARLRAQGVNAASVDYAGAVDEDMVAPTSGKPNFAQRVNNDRAHVPNPPPRQPATAVNPRNAAKVNTGKVADLLTLFKSKLAERGPMGLIGMQRRFRIMDDDGSQSLSKSEFTKAIKELKVGLSDNDINVLFAYFDRDNSGSIEYNEFLYAVRGELNDRRRALVHLAFKILDKDGSGVLEPSDVIQIYDTSKHPEVISKRKTKEQVMREFLDGFDVGGEVDGKVTLNEFENYYSNISASIDNDDYFELMIRNAWRMSGGVGMAANSANTRVLVTRADGTQGVEEIKNNLGLRAKDKEGMVARLRAQGVNAASVDYAGAVDEPQTDAGQLAIAVSKAPSSSLLARLNNKVNSASQSPVKVKPAPTIPSKKQVQPELSPEEIALAGPKLRSNPSMAQAINPSTASTNTKKKITTAILTNQSHKLAPPPGVTLIIDKIKYELKNRDAHGYTGLIRMFKSIDIDNNNTLSLVELKNGLKSMDITIDDVDTRQLFTYFDKDGSGSIDLDEFVNGLREPVNERRVYIINCAFNKLDTKKQNSVSAEFLASSYDATRHPEVMARRMTTSDALLNFMETFDVSNDGYVSKEEFQNYYVNISQSIDNDDYFELLLRNTWRIDPREKVPTALKVENIENNNILNGIKELGSPTKNDDLLSVDSQILESVQQEVKQYRMDAIAKFNSKQYDRAQKLFECMLNSLLLIYPESHPDVLKAKKSIAACNRASQ